MASPAEHLVRDYLSRLSVAARGQLDAADRRALVNRTHDFIERETGLSGRPEPKEVGKLLAGLGDPSGLVRMERERLAVLRGEEPGGSQQPGRGRVGRGLWRDAGRLGATWHWPRQQGQAGLQLTLLEGGLADPGSASAPTAGGAADSEPGLAPWAEGPAASPARPKPAAWPQPLSSAQPLPPTQPLPVRPLSSEPLSSEPWSPLVSVRSGDEDNTEPLWEAPAGGGYGSGGWLLAELTGEANAGGQGGAAGQAEAGESAEFADPAGLSWHAARPQIAELAARAAGRVASFVRSMPGRWRRHPVEMTALLLLGPGGLIFPPVWLAGAAVALFSKLWHPLEKWIGLAGPVLLTLIGSVIGAICAGNETLGHDVHEGWVLAVIVSRVSAVLSACYLAWWASRGRRQPFRPPWERPNKTG